MHADIICIHLFIGSWSLAFSKGIVFLLYDFVKTLFSKIILSNSVLIKMYIAMTK